MQSLSCSCIRRNTSWDVWACLPSPRSVSAPESCADVSSFCLISRRFDLSFSSWQHATHTKVAYSPLNPRSIIVYTMLARSCHKYIQIKWICNTMASVQENLHYNLRTVSVFLSGYLCLVPLGSRTHKHVVSVKFRTHFFTMVAKRTCKCYIPIFVTVPIILLWKKDWGKLQNLTPIHERNNKIVVLLVLMVICFFDYVLFLSNGKLL
jgi:hypothetical protein